METSELLAASWAKTGAEEVKQTQVKPIRMIKAGKRRVKREESVTWKKDSKT